MTPTPAAPIPTPGPTAVPYFGFFGGSPDPLVNLLFDLGRALVVLLIALFVARLVKRWVVHLFARSRISLNIAVLVGNILQALVIVLGLTPFAAVFGLDWAAVVAVLGAVGLGLSLAMQDLLKNVVAGIYILLEHPFKIGDRISVKDATGVVRSIELRTTILSTDEGLQMVVPNNVVLNEIVTNRSASNLQRQVIVIEVPNASLTNTTAQVNAALRDFADIVASPAPVVALEGVTDGTARMRVEFWVPAGTHLDLTSRVVEALQARFPNANVAVV
ncbi:MAG: mechanosensitive ion channel family protein [Chloroflexota bacterium]|nr:mechanosensitive ion channel family protein [Chloroflexota bacterium]MDQ5866284.1 mechanosensitive ion channel family protein [Chloroflexota bacterium]